MKALLVVMTLLLVAGSTAAQKARRQNRVAAMMSTATRHTGRYMWDHKVLVVGHATVLGLSIEDGITTRHAERVCQRCVDMGFFGPHPSYREVAVGEGLNVLVHVFFSEYGYHKSSEGDPTNVVGPRFFSALFTVPFIVSDIADINDNLNAAKIRNKAAVRSRVTGGY